MSNLIDDIRKVEVAGKLRLLHETACEGYDENALLDQARDTIAAELAAKDAEIARLHEADCGKASAIREFRKQADADAAEIARLRAALTPFRNAAKHAGGYSQAFICAGDWVRAVEVMGD